MRASKARRARERADPEFKEKLRKKFVETAMKYQGVVRCVACVVQLETGATGATLTQYVRGALSRTLKSTTSQAPSYTMPLCSWTAAASFGASWTTSRRCVCELATV